MSLNEKMKAFYESVEDSYYELLDGVNKKVPIYRVVDRVDEVVPSLPLFLLLFLLLLFGIGLFFFGGGNLSEIGFKVVDQAGMPVANAAMNISVDGETRQVSTNSQGQFSISVKKGATLDIETFKEGFIKDTRTVFASDDRQSETIALSSTQAFLPLKKVIKFSDPSGKLLLGKELIAEFSCSSGIKLLKSKYTTTTGEVELIPPENCGQLMVKVSADGFETGSFVVEEGKSISLAALGSEAGKGSVTFRVSDAKTQELLDGLSVELRTNENIKTGEGTTSWGEKTITNIAGGIYYGVISDPAGKYASKTTERFNVVPNVQTIQEVQVSREVSVYVKVKVLDVKGSKPIANAKVLLKDDKGNVVGAEQTVNASGEATFGLEENIVVFATAMHEKYLTAEPEKIETVGTAKGATVTKEIKLEEWTEGNSGIVSVVVKDEETKPVENATIYLFDGETGFLCDACGESITDVDGQTVPNFRGVKPGKYYAVAQKFPAQGQSEPIDVLEKHVNKIEMTMTIGKGTLLLKAVDADGETVGGAKATIETETGEEIGTVVLDSKGEAKYQLKADKKIFVTFTKQGYAKYVTASIQIYPDVEFQIIGVLEREILGNTPELNFQGIFTKDGQNTNKLSAGGLYTAKFQLKIPNGLNGNKEAGIHVRAGKDEDKIVENNDLVINKINAPNATVVKGKTYNAPTGQLQDMQQLTNGEAKWANVTWEKGLEPGIYNVEVEVKVRAKTTPNSELQLNYRAWVVNSASAYVRTPADSELGTAKETGSKKELYAAVFIAPFDEGKAPKCNTAFCYSEKLKDLEEGLYLSPPYQITIYQDHEFEFEISNNSPKVHDNATIQIRNIGSGGKEDESLIIKSFEITNANSQKFQQTGLSAKKLDPVALGSFGQNKSVAGKLMIEPKAEQQLSLEIKIVSSGNEVFKEIVKISVVKAERLVAEVKPETLPAYSLFDLDVKVTYGAGEKSGLNVEGALVKVKKIAPDTSESTLSLTTDSTGAVKFVIPASSPGTKLVVTVEKAGYRTEKVEKEISSKVAKLEPEGLVFNLNLSSMKEQELPLTVTNLISYKLKIKEINIDGDFEGLLDLTQMSNWVKQFVETTAIEKDKSKIVKVKAALSDEALQLNEEMVLNGDVLVDFTNEQGTAIWSLGVPITVNIFLAEPPKNPNCVNMSIKTWEDSTMEAKISKEFKVTNTCVTKLDEPMNLKNLSARVKWNSDKLGDVELTLVDHETGESLSSVMKEGIWTRMFNNVDAEKEYIATLTFTPYADTLGKTAEFDVEIDAQPRDAKGEQFVGSSNLIKSNILIVNLEQCIKYTPTINEGVEIAREANDAKVAIDTSACGPIDIDLRFCYGDNGCKGGALEGGIGVRPLSIDNVKGDTMPSITIERKDIPGMYGVKVEARPKGGSWREVSTIDALIHPRAGDSFTLDKYFFTVMGTGAKDAAVLKNATLSEQVMVSASVCDWAKVQAKGPGFNFATAGAGAAVGALMAVGSASVVASIGATAAIAVGALAGFLVGGLVIMLLAGMFGEDPCKESQTAPLIDYIMNLKEDAKSIGLDNSNLGAEWNTEEAKINGNFESQEVGIVVENRGLNSEKPTYSTMTATALRHYHAQPTIYTPGNSNFGPFNVRDSQALNYTQKFHLKFKTAEEVQKLQEVSFDTYSCNKGILQGRNGPGALPKMRNNWSWLEESGGIAYDSCDTENDDSVYCDATQFSIALTKRMAILNDFLAANNYSFECPTNPIEQTLQNMTQQNSTHTVVAGKLGMSSIAYNVSGQNLTATVELKNNTSTGQKAKVTMNLQGPPDVTLQDSQKSCTRTLDNVAANGAGSVSCTFSSLPKSESYYVLGTDLSSESTTSIDAQAFFVSFKVKDTPSTTDCWMAKTTSTMDNKSGLAYYLGPNTEYTDKIRTQGDLEHLLHFKANLKYDAFSDDFRKDFVKYYSEDNFADTLSFFHRLGQDGTGNYYGLMDYFLDTEKMKFRKKFTDNDYALSAPGSYKVDIDVDFEEGGNKFRVFGTNGELLTGFSVTFYLLNEPEINNPLYYIPFDGHVGFKNGIYEREGYGVAYSPESSEEVIKISDGPEPVKTIDSAGSNALVNLDIAIDKDLYNLNSSPSTRGNVISIEKGADASKKKLTFFKSYATPVMMKVNKAATSEESFSAFYSISENDVPKEVGSTATYWDGAGNCLNFDGTPVVEAFKNKADRAATEADKVSTWQTTYGTDWESVKYAGNVYLRTILYTPRDSDNVLKAVSPEVSFITPDSELSAVPLNGISTMKYNKPGNSQNDMIDSLQDVLDLVESGALCMNNTGTEAEIWWDPKTVYAEAGTTGSIHDRTEALVAGQTCIGYENAPQFPAQ